eukprot:m.2367 g.2367  ORF g.2367 m.2367 type:complete len:230 (-) comp1768_c0_seq1:22-711(-)
MSLRRTKHETKAAPAEYRDVWFVKNFVGIGPVKGRFVHTLINGHPTELADLYEAEYLDGDNERMTKEEADGIIAACKCEPPTKEELDAAKVKKLAMEEEQEAKKAKLAESSSSTTSTTTTASSTSTPTSKSKSKSRVKSKSKSQTKSKAVPDSWYGEQFKVEALVDRKYEPCLKYKVRWEGKWSPQDKVLQKHAQYFPPLHVHMPHHTNYTAHPHLRLLQLLCDYYNYL